LNPLAPLYKFADRVRFRLHGNVGRGGEDRAHRFLRRAGYIVVARNWRPPQGGGEIDLVAWDLQTLVFVEVKTRISGERNAAVRDIDTEKIRVLRRAARDYVRRAGVEGAEGVVTRFDVIAIEGSALEHIRDAFRLLPSS
jgi:putative endonuclease